MTIPLPRLTLAAVIAASWAVLPRSSWAAPPQPGGALIDIKRDPKRIDVIRQRLKDRTLAVKASGADRRSLLAQITPLTLSWRQLATALGERVSFGDWECYAAGCLIVTRHGPGGSLTRTLSEFAHAKVFHQWNAGKSRSAPLPAADGTTEVTWFFAAPPANGPILLPDDLFADFPAPKKPR